VLWRDRPGKTCSARRYARWDVAEPMLTTWGPREPSDDKVYEALAQNRAIFYTPTVCCPLPRSARRRRKARQPGARQATEVGVAVHVLNRMLELECPNSVRIA